MSEEWNQHFEGWAEGSESRWLVAVSARSPGRSLALDDLLSSVGDVCRGRVKFFRADKGWGGIESTQTPFDVWVHFSSIDGSGFRELTAGEEVEFRWEPVVQDSWLCTATWVRRLTQPG